MKIKITFFIFVTLATGLFSQNGFNCISHDAYTDQLNSNPQFKINQQLLEQETAEFIKQWQLSKGMMAPPKIIPMVFHVIHTGGAGNISDAQIIDQVNILNKEFIRMQADTVLTPAAFQPVAGKFNVEFRLATIDPSGNCTNGINRIYSNLAQCSVGTDDYKSLIDWPSNKYLNIWLVEVMHYSSSTSCNGGGYATFPGGSSALDGVAIRGDLIGSIGTAATNPGWGNFLGRYLIHELGHWFNLRHIWGDATCGDDFVSDTPKHVTSNSGCPSFPYNANNSCGTGANGEMFTDYMDYTNGPCLNMFTAGQVARMDACINSALSGRNNLWTTTNLNATGTNNPYTYPVACAASPEVLPYGPIVCCVGDSVQFTDYSYGGKETSRLWNFFGNPASSLTDSIVKVKYNTPGVYNIALTTSFGSSNKTKTFNAKVYVLANTVNPNYTVPFTDSFENATDFNNDWVRVNHDNDTTWRRFTNTAFTGSACVGIKNYDNFAPLKDELISPAYDLSSLSTATLSFRLHFATQTTSDYDKMEVYMSTNCGQTWSIKYTRVAAALKTVTVNYTTSHIPPAASATEWRKETISLTTNTWGSNPVRFKFKFTSGGGNNIFIDDINIFGVTATDIAKNTVDENGVLIYPNPAQNNLNVNLNLSKNSDVDIIIKDVTGKTVLNKTSKLLKGENKIQLETTQLSSGLYFVQVNSDGNFVSTKKIVISK